MVTPEIPLGGRSSVRRRIHVVATVVYAAFLYVFSPMSLFVFGWFADFEDAISHRVHEVSIGALFTLGFVGVLTHLKRTERAGGAIQAVVSLCFAAGVIMTTTGFEPLVLAYLLPPLALIVLDPEWREAVSPPMHRDTRLFVLAWILVALVGPQIPVNFTKAGLLVQGHEAHWGAMAAFAMAVAILAVVVSHRPPGWRVTAWSVLTVVTANAVVSLAFRFDASALRASAALLALIWVGGFGIAVVIASMDPAAVPRRRPDLGLVAGVASGLSARTALSASWIRAGFAVPIVGTAAYLLLWLMLPTDAVPVNVVRRRTWIVALVVVGAVTIPFGTGFFLLPLAVVAGSLLIVKQAVGGASGREWRRGVMRAAAGLGVIAAMFGIAAFWLIGETSPPNVPHRIDNISVTYCAGCHGNSGVARGAPVFDTVEHSGGASCISCHDHLPPTRPIGADALWRSPLERDR